MRIVREYVTAKGDGFMPKIIKRTCNLVNIPVITGGLIDEKEDIINALNSGAEGISTTDITLWDF